MGVRFAGRVGNLRGGGSAHGVGNGGMIHNAVVVSVVNRFEHIASSAAVAANVLYPRRPGEVPRVRRFNCRGRVDLRTKLQDIRRGQREARPGGIGRIGNIGVAADAIRPGSTTRDAKIEVEHLRGIIPRSGNGGGRIASNRAGFNRNSWSPEARRLPSLALDQFDGIAPFATVAPLAVKAIRRDVLLVMPAAFSVHAELEIRCGAKQRQRRGGSHILRIGGRRSAFRSHYRRLRIYNILQHSIAQRIPCNVAFQLNVHPGILRSCLVREAV